MSPIGLLFIPEGFNRSEKGFAVGSAQSAMRASEKKRLLAHTSASSRNNDADLLCDLRSGALTGDHPTIWSPTARGREQRPAIDLASRRVVDHQVPIVIPLLSLHRHRVKFAVKFVVPSM